ncbi:MULTISPECIES: SPOR domain-containing protein [Stenotrophomonas]|uniref:DUF1176 domain-containing protein n=1 Tax=Stenotrophomonas maltophilia TaxID=40324 RepID=A0A2J0UAS5_STEMA|nr:MULTISPECIES: hypothetical protein [Stenotrophomonas]PJL28164.1 hypothetical protein B9Y64_13090 [Stenotrophomonas maltophilia]HDS1145021.1 hypothetical protein [Stenotrophomonas maltophilia]HDS1163313.1 hypothetical protein [Stenotrophomonas maltophilia]
MIRSHLKPSVSLMLLLACSACAPAGERAVPVAPIAKAEAKPSALPAQAGPTERGLPALPEASGSAHPGGRYGALPEPARRVLAQLKCNVEGASNVQVLSIPAQGGQQDFMVTDRGGPHFRYWIRSFSSSGGATGYLVQLRDCPATTTGMRAYIAQGAAPLQDVTASLLAQAGLPDGATMTAYQDKGAGDLFAFIGVLDKVPVLRWVAEADPEQPLAADARSFDHGNAIHGGFLRWNQDHFEVARTVPATLWPCDDSPLLPCRGDPFVIGR